MAEELSYFSPRSPGLVSVYEPTEDLFYRGMNTETDAVYFYHPVKKLFPASFFFFFFFPPSVDILHPLLQCLDGIVQRDWFSWGDKVGFEGRKSEIRAWLSPHTSWAGERGSR